MLVQVYGDSVMKKTEVYKWVKSFSEGKESVTVEERSGRPATSRTEENIAKVRQICVKIVGCQKHSRASEHRQRNRKILTEYLDMRKVCTKMVPKELNEEQKQRRVFSY